MKTSDALSEQIHQIIENTVEDRVAESLADHVLRMEDVGWEKLVGNFDADTGLTLEQLKELEEPLVEMVGANPLLVRGAQLRFGYVFGKGMIFKDLKPGAQQVVDQAHNKRALFSVQAYEELNKADMTTGNVFILYDKRDKRFTRVPLRQITGVVTREDDAEEILYLKRSWTANGKDQQKWYPLHSNTKPAPSIESNGQRIAVDKAKVFYHDTANKQVGWTFGIPTALPAMAWAKAYSEYLKNNSKLVAAYAQFAYQVTRATKKGVDDAAVKLRTGNGNEVGGTAVTNGNGLQPVNPTGSQVNFNNGQPLAAMVASSLGVSIIALLSSPGAASGSYGAAQTLDAPTIIVMQSIQDRWALFYENIFHDIGSKSANVEFPAIETDPTYRLLGIVAQLVTNGIIHREEARDLALDLLDVQNPKAGLPEPDWFNIGGQTNSSEDEDEVTDPNPRQGNSGMAGSPTQGDTNNDGRTDTIGSE